MHRYDEHSHTLLTRRRAGRFDIPYGSCDTFGVACMLSELLYGICDLVPEHKASAHLLCTGERLTL